MQVIAEMAHLVYAFAAKSQLIGVQFQVWQPI
jgi:hypothetical protein